MAKSLAAKLRRQAVRTKRIGKQAMRKMRVKVVMKKRGLA